MASSLANLITRQFRRKNSINQNFGTFVGTLNHLCFVIIFLLTYPDPKLSSDQVTQRSAYGRAYRGVHRPDWSRRDVSRGRLLCLEHHAALGSQSDDDRTAASAQQLPSSLMRLLHAGYRGARQQLSLRGDPQVSVNTRAHTHTHKTLSI